MLQSGLLYALIIFHGQNHSLRQDLIDLTLQFLLGNSAVFLLHAFEDPFSALPKLLLHILDLSRRIFEARRASNLRKRLLEQGRSEELRPKVSLRLRA